FRPVLLRLAMTRKKIVIAAVPLITVRIERSNQKSPRVYRSRRLTAQYTAYPAPCLQLETTSTVSDYSPTETSSRRSKLPSCIRQKMHSRAISHARHASFGL